MTIRDYSDTAILQMTVVFKESMETIENRTTTMAGRPAHLLVYQAYDEHGDVKLKVMHVWTVVDGVKVYQFTYGASQNGYDIYFGTVKKMLRSFKVLK